MFKLSVPISTKTVNANNREIYLRQLKEAGVDRVFLCGIGEPADEVPRRVTENVEYFKSKGFEVGLWISALGHGFVLVSCENDTEQSGFQDIISVKGERISHAHCPLDKGFRKRYKTFVGKLAATGADIIMFDDDFRMSQREEDISCACPLHLALISEMLGEEVTRDMLKEHVLSGKPNKYRDAWLKSQEEGLLILAREVREEVDKVASSVTVCSCISESGWNVGGLDAVALSKTLAGRNRPVMRLTGAPYWAATGNYTLVAAIEEARLLASFCDGEDIDLMCEGDVYPRPRYTCPASYLELYEAAQRASGGYKGILKYMFDYVAGPNFETGYLALHNENKAYREKVSEWFGDGANEGVRIIARPHTMKDADLDLSSLYSWSPVAFDGATIANSGIPTVYRGEGVCKSVFGENARRLGLSELKNGAVLDAVSAVILTQRGIDVGLKSYGAFYERSISFLNTEDAEFKSYIANGNVRFLSCELCGGARAVLFANGDAAAYTYENADGDRFFVFLYEADSNRTWAPSCNSGLLKNYATQDALIRYLPWIARHALPAYCKGNPELSLMCRRDGDTLAVAIFNCFADALVNPVIVLDGEYGEIECVGCNARLEGNKAVLTSKLYGFSSAMIRVKNSN